MKAIQFKNNSKLAIPVIFTVLLLVASAVTLYSYSAILSKKGLYAIAGTQENYSWSTAKFVIKLAEFETFITEQKNLNIHDIEKLRMKFEILYSRFYILESDSESTKLLYREPGYPEVINKIRQKMEYLDELVNNQNIDLQQISQTYSQIKPLSIEIANLADHAEVKQRTGAYEDFIEKRRIIFSGLVIVISAVIVLAVITLIVLRQQRQTIRQQALAIEAQKATDSKNAFLGAVGHELRASLQSIMSAIDVLMNTNFMAEHVDTFQRLENAAQQIENQMKDLTDYAHLESGMMALRIVSFNVQQMINETADEITLLIPKTEVSLIREVEFTHAQIHSDPLRIRQILVNLLTNAFKYTENGTITLHSYLNVQPTGNTLIIKITDTGIGIEKTLLPQIFEPFTQLYLSDTRQYAGVGMGLAIVHGLIKLLNGTIAVHSEVGKGSTFSVTIPVAISEEQIPHKNGQQALKPLKKEQHILIIDDNSETGHAFINLLNKLGYQHELCDSSERALQKLLRRPYDALVLDLQMHSIDSVAIARTLRDRRGPNRNIPIIGISAPTAELSSAGQKDMFDDYLMKPVRIEALSVSLTNLFSAKD
ncbi:hybrid sensor histidine kinase/response regulator [Serratia sp. UGAL515B_01]|uniref:ATP-binding response regulator n=1 Tax=Serratia sp. UGAL515B_01 TaxID=2986763 RepID=UPI0029544CC6|nr:hybrid sensor histidine kinase/response regulator [Serratia sp. UGAL515B_01]WON77159.1 hybrid sensor histidine kinase/response regulator [Serratia sp. UGAL515B_01]